MAATEGPLWDKQLCPSLSALSQAAVVLGGGEETGWRRGLPSAFYLSQYSLFLLVIKFLFLRLICFGWFLFALPLLRSQMAAVYSFSQTWSFWGDREKAGSPSTQLKFSSPGWNLSTGGRTEGAAARPRRRVRRGHSAPYTFPCLRVLETPKPFFLAVFLL